MQRECNKPEVNDQSWKEFKKTEVDHEQENFVKACDEKSVEIQWLLDYIMQSIKVQGNIPLLEAVEQKNERIKHLEEVIAKMHAVMKESHEKNKEVGKEMKQLRI